jgi:hypothetical protein
MGDSPVHRALQRIAGKLEDLQVPYAVVGAMALGIHGFRRVTTDVDLLLTREGLATFKDRWLGRGYVEKFPGGKAVRDVEDDVRIDILTTGEFPGDGKPKPVSFPDPGEGVAVRVGRFSVLALERLLEMKIASGMSAAHRLRDFADVIATVETLDLPAEFGDALHPYVREKFRELWVLAQASRRDDY